MLRLDITLMRDTTAAAEAAGGAPTSRSTPSTRKRTTRSPSNGSRWMSEERISRARAISWFTVRMTGASLAMSRSWSMSSTSIAAADTRPTRSISTPSAPAPACAWRAAWISPPTATSGWTRLPSASSSACRVSVSVGSAMATSTTASASSTGTTW